MSEQEHDHIGEMFARIKAVQDDASVSAVFGEPVTVDDKIVIPVARVSYGFGFGFGEGTDRDAEKLDMGSGCGAGGGAGAEPIALIEITPERTRVEPIIDEQKISLAGILLAAWSVFWAARAVMHIFGNRRNGGGCC
jgi:uncharacterized spore protein YtfJ